MPSTRARCDWNDQLTITDEAKAVGSAGFDKLQPGAKVSVRNAAQQMISASDNMATDLLIDRLGPGAVERALVDGGPSRPGQHDARSRPRTSCSRSAGASRTCASSGSRPSPQERAQMLGADEYPSLRTGSEAHPHPGLALRRRVVRQRRRHLPRPRRAAGRRGRARPRRSRTSCRPFPASTSTGRSGPTSAPRAETCPAT